MKGGYSNDFYKDRHQNTLYSARTILSILTHVLPEIKSVIDFGCGVGTWLSVLKEQGVNEIQGVDGPWVKQTLLEIPRDKFRQINFENTINCEKKYDLAITLEVAEHISQKSVSDFIESVTSAADFILFSAAIPFQGGCGHINERWPIYWEEMFADRGFVVLDFVRQRIWNDKQIPFWYRQNILFFAKKERVNQINLFEPETYVMDHPLSLVHPDMYLIKNDQITDLKEQIYSVKGSWKFFRRAVVKWFMKKIGRS